MRMRMRSIMRSVVMRGIRIFTYSTTCAIFTYSTSRSGTAMRASTTLSTWCTYSTYIMPSTLSIVSTSNTLSIVSTLSGGRAAWHFPDTRLPARSAIIFSHSHLVRPIRGRPINIFPFYETLRALIEINARDFICRGLCGGLLDCWIVY